MIPPKGQLPSAVPRWWRVSTAKRGVSTESMIHGRLIAQLAKKLDAWAAEKKA